MLSISSTHKQKIINELISNKLEIFSSDSKFDVITETNIESESMSLKQSICDENKLKFGERKNILKNMIQMEPYKSVITKNINMENINSKQRMMVSLLKENKYGSVIFMFMIRNRISK